MNVSAPPGRTRLELPSNEAEWSTDDELRAHAIASLKRKRKLWEDFIGFAVVNAALWLIWGLTDPSTDGGMPWPAWVSVIWGFLLLLDGIRAYGHWPTSGPITDQEIEREIRRKGGR